MSDNIVISPKDPQELESVYELFARSFGPDYFSARENFQFLLENEPYAPLQNHLIVKEANNEVVGALRLVDRLLMFGPIMLRAGGMSLFAVNPQFWYKGIAHSIQKAFLEWADNTFDITFGFARRRMDGYWSRFGYIGYTSFALLTVDTKTVPADDGECNLVNFSDTHLPDYQQYYLDSYQNVFGSVHRDDALWNYYLKKINHYGLGTLYSFKGQNNRLVGYALVKENTVLDIAGDSATFPGMVKALVAKLGKTAQAVDFNLSPAHPFFKFLLRFNHTYTIRRVWNGGHIARTAPVSKFLEKIRPVLEARLRDADCSSFSIKVNDQAFDWTGTRLETRPLQTSDHGDVEFDAGEWQKILLGIVPTSDVKGFQAVTKRDERIVHTLFPVLWPQTPEPDQF